MKHMSSRVFPLFAEGYRPIARRRGGKGHHRNSGDTAVGWFQNRRDFVKEKFGGGGGG